MRDRLRRVPWRRYAAGALLFCLPLAQAGGAAAVCIACEADRGALERISPEMWRALERGEVAVEHGRSGEEEARAARAWALLPHRAGAVWQVLTAFESWPNFLPNLRKTEVLRREGNRVWLRNRIRVLWLDLQSAPIYELHPEEGRITWRLDPNQQQDLERVEGVWQILPLEDRDACLVQYRILLDAGRGIPRPVEEMLTRRSLPDVLRGLAREIEAELESRRVEREVHRPSSGAPVQP